MGQLLSALRVYCRKTHHESQVELPLENLLEIDETDQKQDDEMDPVYNPGENIYFDVDSMTVTVNTKDKTHHSITEHVVPRYKKLCAEKKSIVCKLADVLDGISLPPDATHLKVSIINHTGDRCYIPFHLAHVEENFPCDIPAMIQELDPDDLPTSIGLVEYIHGHVTTRDLTMSLQDYAWDDFLLGFTYPRPHAWTFLRSLSTDENAEIYMSRTTIDNRKEFFSLKMYTFERTGWFG